MNWISQSFLWVHAAAAIVWIGGIFFMMAIAVPLAGPAVGALGKRFSGVADWCIALLVVTGVVVAFSEGYAHSLAGLPLLKLLMAATMISVHYYRGKVLAPRISRSGEVEAARLKPLSARLAWFNLALGFLIVFVSMVLA
ncbi:MAG TPA: hypothetical protein DDW94_09125 [Deltaproteobacteria bacterium]|nr:MAG: hypothetical protein A2Z79_03630 [Deltaproteobacteria bacterium GWA2_55_82]OGQ63639.1 MAG: hypothetical protein A3I81_02730 [Deltaproteobacteria bacterium RIFCSPLOWO2_02_FULL_55_12]OIJ74475.1 MAG: hypothetical protein A2V21_309530 [Deltaproteobacteria bacterium GWC2_55_46]HBG47132.1 hypothetical protein [Deltaproteobacteria bacterium]HCY10807.1 hypothetical protein [Deltaproteobacteria bacterium]